MIITQWKLPVHPKMSSIPCPAPDCTQSWPDSTNPDVLLRLIDLHARTAHPPTHDPPTASAPPSVKAEKVKRPAVAAAGTSEDWVYFKQRWSEYKAATRLTGSDVIFQLLECCDESLRKDLTRTFGNLTSSSEDTVLKNIKTLAVRQESTMVARFQLQQMMQDRDEPVRAYAARIRGQAGVCQYTTECGSCKQQVDYSDEMVRDTIIRGLEDNDIRLDILSDTNQAMTVEQTITLVEAKESGKRSASRLLGGDSISTAAAAQSSYRRSKQPQRNRPPPQNNATAETPCGYCGKTGHSQSRQEWISRCPAYNHTCARCGTLHHHETVCRKSQRKSTFPAAPLTHDGATAVFQTLCTINDLTQCEVSQPTADTCAITLDHHVYNELCDMWERRASDPQPMIGIRVHVDPTDMKALKIPPHMPRSSNTVLVSAMADTGCQSCLAGTALLGKLGLQKQDLLPVSMKMTTASNNGIDIAGALVLRLCGDTPSGDTLSTRQIVYFTDSTDRLFLSKQACVALQIIPTSFPTIGEAPPHESQCSTSSQPPGPCDCPRREMPPHKPASLPFPATAENRSKLEQWLLKYYKSSTFNVCEHQPLPMMSGPPLRLMVDPEAKPTAHHTPIPVPIHWQDEVKADLDRDVRLGVLEPVPVGTPVTWCSKMVVAAKKSGKPRRTVDFQALNRHALRETHHTQSPFHQARSVPPNTYKTVMDTWNGYHSIPLHEDDRHLTTFITPWGRYRYCVAPQGYIASGDGYTRRFDEIVSDVPRKTKCVDDSLLWDESIADSFFHTVDYLDLCGHNGVTLNPSKFAFAQTTVEFAGFDITSTTVRPCPQFIEAIQNFPTPQNITDVRSWFGLINQVSYAFASAERMQPFRNLLKPGTRFIWTTQLNDLFEESKSLIVSEIYKGVEIYDKNKPTCLVSDWSKEGIGFWLFQKHCECQSSRPFCCNTGWKTTLVGSRFTSGAESRYAPIEGEALALVDALEKARHFVLGCPNLTVAVDHKPLVKTFSDRSLDGIPNPRLLNLKERSLRFRFHIIHIPGVRNFAADAVSRHPVGDPVPLHLPDDVAPLRDILASVRAREQDTAEVCHQSSKPTLVIQSITWDDVRQQWCHAHADPLHRRWLPRSTWRATTRAASLFPVQERPHQFWWGGSV